MNVDERELDDDPRLMQAARDYLAELESGRKPDREAYLKRCPELAEAMAECFDGIELAHAAGVALRPAGVEPSPTAEPMGDFRIVREIGRGGMGIVYEAVQLSLGRRVALKVLPFASGLDSKHLQRFRTEAHAAAQLHHGNIVPVYAVGCERGVHFYAMQIIDGRSLDRVIREWRGGQPNESSSSSTIDLCNARTKPQTATTHIVPAGRGREFYRMAARIVVQVGDALEFAHEAGVIHRDIKPANLLLDGKGNIWVTDFGLAQISADAGVTQTGDVFGTLRYMSPEQASGRRILIDHRTDVYSLGATLYELLTLQPIFPGNDRPTLLHQILDAEPRRPRLIDRSIPVELETIVMKSLAKLPEERYATAGELAADLRRFLDEKPIQARQPSFIDRSRKWTRRHPGLLAAGVLLLIFSVAVLAATTALVSREQGRTQAAYELERQRTQEADERFKLAQRSADDMIRMAEDELSDQPQFQTLRTRLLESALAYYQELIEMRRHDPSAQAELALTRDRVKRILDDLAVIQGAAQAYLLKDPAIVDDLRLDDSQRASAAALTARVGEQLKESFGEFHRLSSDERKQRFLEVARANDAALSAILTPDQLRRLGQIALQCQGLTAFKDPKIVAMLNLTADQREQIRVIESEMFSGNRGGSRPNDAQAWPAKKGPAQFGPGRPDGGPGQVPKDDHGRPPQGDPGRPPQGDFGGPPRKLHEQMLAGAFEKIEKVLKPEQMKKWKEMTGEPLKGGIPFWPAGGFGSIGPRPGPAR